MNKQYHMLNYIASYIQTIYVDRNDTMKLCNSFMPNFYKIATQRENDLEP